MNDHEKEAAYARPWACQVCALDRVIGATSGHAAGLGEESRAAQNQGGPSGILPVAAQRAKLQSSVQPNRTSGGMQPLG